MNDENRPLFSVYAQRKASCYKLIIGHYIKISNGINFLPAINSLTRQFYSWNNNKC